MGASFEEGAGNREALALTAGKLIADGADTQREAFRQILDELQRVGVGGRLRSMSCFGCTLFAIEQAIIADAVVEERRVLADERQSRAQGGEWHGIDGQCRRSGMRPSISSASKKRAMQSSSSVVLPLPEAPTKATVSPAATSRREVRRALGATVLAPDSGSRCGRNGWRPALGGERELCRYLLRAACRAIRRCSARPPGHAGWWSSRWSRRRIGSNSNADIVVM